MSAHTLSDITMIQSVIPVHAFFIRLAAAACLLLTTQVSLAQGDSEVKACAEAYEQAQVSRNAGQLQAAQQHLTTCVRDVCPDFVKVDCGQWLSEIKREVPSVIFSASDSSGEELSDVRVVINGEIVSDALDGIAVEMDPGQHDVTFEYDGKKLTKKLIVRQGEKNRVFRVEFVTTVDSDGDGVADDADFCPDAPGPQSADGCPPKQVAAAPVIDASGSSPVTAYILWGVGAAGLATFGVFATLGKSAEDDALEQCPTNPVPPATECTTAEKQEFIDDVDQKFLIANIGLGVGATGAVVGTVLFFLSQQGDTASSPTYRVGGGPTVDGGGFVSVSGSF